LLDGESLDIFWTRENLEELRSKDDLEYLYAFFIDVLGDVYKAPFPGVTAKKLLLRRNVTYQLPVANPQSTNTE
jgi:hypothetical protein